MPNPQRHRTGLIRPKDKQWESSDAGLFCPGLGRRASAGILWQCASSSSDAEDVEPDVETDDDWDELLSETQFRLHPTQLRHWSEENAKLCKMLNVTYYAIVWAILTVTPALVPAQVSNHTAGAALFLREAAHDTSLTQEP